MKDVFLNGKPYLDLDVSAQLYSYTKTKTWNQTFRISAEMQEKVNPEQLHQALLMVKPRFPSFFVKFYQDFFWKRLQAVTEEECKNVVQPDKSVCDPIDTEDNTRPLFRLLYTDYRISLEIFHAVTDGRGAFVFLKNILAAYLNIQGVSVSKEFDIFDLNEPPTKAELEDTFLRAYDPKGKHLNRNGKSVYQYVPANEDGAFHVRQGRFSVDDVKKVSKEKGATITEYLTAVYVYAFYTNLENRKKTRPITIQVPMDIRRFYNSVSLRNCSLYANITIMPAEREYTFDDIIAETKRQFKEGIEPTVIQENINVNVHDSVMPISQYSPSFMKTPFVKLAFILYGERLFTTPLSNLGIIQVPEEMRPYIKTMYAIIGRTYKNKIYATIASYYGLMMVSISTTGTENPIADTYFNYLREQGIDVSIEDIS